MAKFAVIILAIFALILATNAAIVRRDADQSSVVSDASQALDKMFEDLNKGIQQLAKDGINFDGVIENIQTKANEFGTKVQELGKEIGEKVQEAAKKQGLAN